MHFFEDKPLQGRSLKSLEQELSQLEDTYAECLKDDMDASSLLCLWTRIKELKAALQSTSNSSSFLK